ncbi:EAL domain-containing protein [Actinoplanes sp. NPDC051861]|uniref:EAL domain-containing protein n=1 Tax=Actinoplanes sp. NPDC051861 TaxID=3155170 RepID=UPI003413EB86
MRRPPEDLATRRLIAAVIVVLGVSMLLTMITSIWEWEDVVLDGAAAEPDEWLAVVAVCWLPLLAVLQVRLVRYYLDATADRRGHSARQEMLRKRISGLLRDDAGVEVVFQPIVDITGRRLAGVEALSRFPGEPYRPPNVWFDEAWEAGLGPELELRAVAAAFERLPELPDSAYLSVNVAPGTMLDPRFLALLDGLGHHASRIVVELTEHAVVDDYTAITGVVEQLRSRGARLAVDDAGAGYATMQHILRLRPDIIKLDRAIVDRADQDPARRALMAAMAAFAASLDTTVIAEGVETAEEVEVLLETGVRLAQGYFFGRPGPMGQAVSHHGLEYATPQSLHG